MEETMILPPRIGAEQERKSGEGMLGLEFFQTLIKMMVELLEIPFHWVNLMIHSYCPN